jgi:hypothetical protein
MVSNCSDCSVKAWTPLPAFLLRRNINSHQLSQRINNTRQKSLPSGIVNIGRSSVCWRRLNDAARAPSPPHSGLQSWK